MEGNPHPFFLNSLASQAAAGPGTTWADSGSELDVGQGAARDHLGFLVPRGRERHQLPSQNKGGGLAVGLRPTDAAAAPPRGAGHTAGAAPERDRRRRTPGTPPSPQRCLPARRRLPTGSRGAHPPRGAGRRRRPRAAPRGPGPVPAGRRRAGLCLPPGRRTARIAILSRRPDAAPIHLRVPEARNADSQGSWEAW